MASETWKTFAQTGKEPGPLREWLLARAASRVAASPDPLPVKRYMADLEDYNWHVDNGVHASGADITNHVFVAHTREGALVAYWDWMNANWPAVRGPECEVYDHYEVGTPGFYDDVLVDMMFDNLKARELRRNHLIELAEAPEEHAAPDGL